MTRRRPWGRIVAQAVLLAVLGIPAAAQGTVAGRIAIAERPGEETTDIANTVIYLVPTDPASARTAPERAEIAMKERTFTPRVQVVTPGSRVAFPNQDPFQHNIFSTTPGAVFDLGLYPSGRSRDTQFRRTGAFPVYCNIHPRMSAFVLVVSTPWHTLAGEDGTWQIANVPAGRYTLHVWHERAEEYTQDVTVAAGGLAGTDVRLDARGFRFEQHKNKFGREYDKSGRDRY